MNDYPFPNQFLQDDEIEYKETENRLNKNKKIVFDYIFESEEKEDE